MSQPDTHAPVTVLGAGIVGICTALSLLERGVPVTIIDRGAPGQETSYGNAGVVSPWSCIPQAMPGIWKNIPKLMLTGVRPLSIHPRYMLKMVPWGLRFLYQSREDRARKAVDAMSGLCGPSIDLFEKHLRGTGHEDLLVDSLYVQAFRDDSTATLDSLDSQMRANKGAELELIGRDALAQMEPALSPDFKAAVVVKGAARVRTPGRVATVLAEKAARMGATFVQADIQRIRRTGDGWMVHCADADRPAGRLVICMGVWSQKLLEGAGVRVPLMSERGYHAEFPDPGVSLNNLIMDVDGKFIASSMEGGLRVAGHAEFGPIDAPPSQRRQKVLARAAKAAFPGLQDKAVNFWMGRRPSFPDSLPMIDEVEGQPGLFLNFGHSHYGLMMSPASGEMVAQMICRTPSNADVTPYAVDRFGRV